MSETVTAVTDAPVEAVKKFRVKRVALVALAATAAVTAIYFKTRSNEESNEETTSA